MKTFSVCIGSPRELNWGGEAWIINIWMRQERDSDKKISLVILSDHVTSVKPMRILYAVLAAHPYISCPCKSGRRRWWSVVSCYKLVTSYSSLCQIKVNVSNWKVKPFNFSALSIIKRRFTLWWHCLSWHIIMILFKSLFNYCGVVVIEMWNFQNITYKKLWKS